MGKMQTEELYDRYLFFLLSISQTRGQISHQTWSYACLHNVLKRTFEVFQSLYNKFGFVINQVTIFLHFQIIYSPLKLNIFKNFDRSSEKNIMEGLEIISTYFKELCHNLLHGNRNSRPVVVIVISLAYYFFTNDPKDISSFYIVLLFNF